MTAIHRISTSAVLLALGASIGAPCASAQHTSLESLSSSGVQQNGVALMRTSGRALSDDGRYLTFLSYATNLTSGDNNLTNDIFLRDRVLGTTTCLSKIPGGSATGDNASQIASMSADGRFVVFESYASNLVAGDTNSYADVFLYDQTTGSLSRISVTSSGAEAGGYDPAITEDGRYVVFASGASNFDPGDHNNKIDIFVRDLVAGTTTLASTDASGAYVANDHCYKPSISDDGRYVAFRTQATNFASPDTGKFEDVFLKDMQTGAIVRMSSTPSGGESGGASYQPRVCGDGHLVFYVTDASDVTATDANPYADVVVYDVATGVNSLVDLSSTGVQADYGGTDPAPSVDGRYCVFKSGARNLDPLTPAGTVYHVFVRDLLQGRCTAETLDPAFAPGNANSSEPSISGDGKHIAFASFAGNLDPADTNPSSINDIFFRDRGEVRFVDYGVGLAGSGGFVPHLFGKDGREIRGDFALEIADGLGATFGNLFIAAAPADLFPVFGGGHFYVDLTAPWLQLPIVVGGAAGVAGAGSLELTGTDLSAYDGTPLYLQLLLVDPGAPRKVAMSNGLEMHIGD
jgi:Tol biopolymer transport system component